ncbi:ester cyclase [Dyadobacter sp. OTU695]|uniref:ester cyclase n=1 Tax=Dyadobacter sp. OTU695 TaxID=3043860 RepID=UPI00313EC82C
MRSPAREPGKVAYEVFTAESDETQFHVRESWSDSKAFEDHLNTPQLKAFTASTNDWLSLPMQATMLKKVERFDNKQVIEKLYQAVNAKDLEYIQSLGADFSEWLDVPFDYTTTGENAIIDPWVSWFGIFPDATCEVKSLVAFGDYVIAQGIGKGTHKGIFHSPAGTLQPTGVSMQVNFCDVYKLRQGKIERADSYFDFYGLLRQLAPEKINAREMV